MRRGQSEAAGVILITGIVLALIAVTYFWGTPLINKQTTSSDVNTATRFMHDVSDQLAGLANAGAGSFTVAVPTGSFKVVAHDAGIPEEDNTISLELPSTVTPLFQSGTIYLEAENYADISDDDAAGTYGSANHNILSMTTKPFGSSYIISLTSKERELDTSGAGAKGFLIRLTTPTAVPPQKILYGKTRVTFTVVSTQTLPGAAANDGDLLVTDIEVNPG